MRLEAQHLAATMGLLVLVMWTYADASPFGASTAERLSVARSLRSEGQLKQAETLLLGTRGRDDAEQSAVLGLLGRISLDRGDLSLAQQRLEGAFAQARAARRDAQAIDDALALAYLLSELRSDFAGAARVLEQAEALAQHVPEARARLSYQRGVLAFNTGELGAALTLFRRAADWAGSDHRSLLFANEMQAFTLASLGHFDAALLGMNAIDLPEASSPCERADHAANHGFVTYLSFEAKRDEAPVDVARLRDLRHRFERAAHESKACGDPQRRKNAELNLGLVALIEGDHARASLHLQAARELSVEDRKLRGWELELAGRLALAQADFSGAESTFRRSVSLSQAAFDLAWSYRALSGLAEALHGAGQADSAADTFALAEQDLDELLQSHAPLSVDQSAFLASRDGALRSWVEVLLARGDVSQAHAVVRRAIARAQRQAALSGLSDGLSAEQRQNVQRELGTYRTLRAELDAQARHDWRKSERALAQARTKRQALQQRAIEALDRAYRFETQRASSAPSVPDGALELTYFPDRAGWLLFAATSDQLKVARVSSAEPEAQTSPLLLPFSELIRGHSQLAIRTYGTAAELDFHALPFEGRPLVDRCSVVYPLEGKTQQSVDDAVAVVLVDPSAAFADSELERQTVSRVLGKRGYVRSLTAVTRADLLSELEHSRFFHFGGHALAAPYDPLSARLLLRNDEALSVADVLSLARVPSEVVLAACASGAPSSIAGPPGLSLAAAFVARGAEHVVGTTRPVSNHSARALVDALFQGLDTGLTFTAAFGRAQRSLMQTAPSLDAAAFRLWTHETEHAHDSQIRCEACMARRESAVERDSLRAAIR